MSERTAIQQAHAQGISQLLPTSPATLTRTPYQSRRLKMQIVTPLVGFKTVLKYGQRVTVKVYGAAQVVE